MSYSGAESSMEDGGAGGGGGSTNRAQTLTGNRRRRNSNNNGLLQGEEYFTGGGGGGCGGGGDGGDPEAWSAFTDSFSKVQTVLDRNRMLIQQANENHQSRIPDNMVKNVAIIQELNGNISKVASIYSDLSVNFTSAVGQKRRQSGGGGGGGKGGNGNGRS